MTQSEQHKRWRARNQAHLQRYERARYAQRVAHRAFVAQWKREHPESKQKENVVRVQRQHGERRNFDESVRRTLWIRQLGECGLCGAGMTHVEIDHIEPLVLGGPHTVENVHLVHPACNRAKGQRRIR